MSVVIVMCTRAYVLVLLLSFMLGFAHHSALALHLSYDNHGIFI